MISYLQDALVFSYWRPMIAAQKLIPNRISAGFSGNCPFMILRSLSLSLPGCLRRFYAMLTNGRHPKSEYRQLAQVEDDNISESQETEKSCDRALRPSYFKLLIISHLLIFGVYASGLWYLLKRKPSHETCIEKFSTHCRIPSYNINLLLTPSQLRHFQ